MLREAHVLRSRGEDVVVGIVETHGRAETEVLLDGLEVVPRRAVSLPGHGPSGIDPDGVLLRKPATVLVDELAHTNARAAATPRDIRTWKS